MGARAAPIGWFGGGFDRKTLTPTLSPRRGSKSGRCFGGEECLAKVSEECPDRTHGEQVFGDMVNTFERAPAGRGCPGRRSESGSSREPDILVTRPFFSADGTAALSKAGIAVIQTELKQRLLDHEGLAELPAVKHEAICLVEGTHFTTLSYWYIRGAEDLARILWLEALGDSERPAFGLAG